MRAKKKVGEIKNNESELKKEDNNKEKSDKKMTGKCLPKLKVVTEQTDDLFSKEALGIGKEITTEDNPFQKPESD